jgi:hypothetical protein
MNKIYLMILLSMVLALPLMAAMDTDYTFKQNTQVDLKRPCINNGTWCSTDAVCNITIISPTNALIKSNVLMTNSVSYHNITLIPNNNLEIGLYKADMTCKESNGYSGSDTFYYSISPSGSSNILGLFIIVILACYSIAFIGFFGKNEIVAMVGGMAMLILGIYLLNNGIDVYRNFMTESFSWITTALGAIFTGMAGMAMLEEL